MQGTNVVKSSKDEILTMEQAEFIETLDKIFTAMLSESKMLRLTQRDYEFARDLLDIHHIMVSPDISRPKANKLIKQMLKCSWTKAKRLMEAHFLLWGDAKRTNLEFKKVIICCQGQGTFWKGKGTFCLFRKVIICF